MPIVCRTVDRHSNDHPGPAIRRAREEVGLSRLGLAYKAGVNPRTVERIEAEEVKPHPATVSAIERVLEDEAVAA